MSIWLPEFSSRILCVGHFQTSRSIAVFGIPEAYLFDWCNPEHVAFETIFLGFSNSPGHHSECSRILRVQRIQKVQYFQIGRKHDWEKTFLSLITLQQAQLVFILLLLLLSVLLFFNFSMFILFPFLFFFFFVKRRNLH